MQQVSMNAMYQFLNDNKDKIEYVKATRFHAYAFNDMEGYQWDNETETDYSDSEFHENFEDWLNTAIM